MIERSLARRPPVVGRLRTALGESTLAAGLVVAGLMLLAILARILMNRHVAAPWIQPDELEYSDLAQSFETTGEFLYRDHATSLHSIYPALISPAWAAHSMQTTYGLAKAINVVLLTAAAIPLYFWARRLVAPLCTVLAVVFYLAIPSFVYTGEILTENAYAPAVLLALFALALALERPTVLRQLLALGLAGLAIAAKTQGIVFALIIPTAIVLKVLFDCVAAPAGSWRQVLRDAARRFWITIGAIAAAALAYVVYKATRGASLSSGLGAYTSVGEVHYSVRDVLKWTVYHAGELTFSVAVFPVSALVVLVGLALRRASAPGPAERAFLACTLAAVFWTLVQVGAFASRFSLRIEERNMFNVAPLLLLALVVWLARGLPRPPALTTAAVLVPAALLLALPYQSFFNGTIYNDTFGLIPLWRVMGRLHADAGELAILVGAGMLVAGLLFATVARRWTQLVIPAAVLAFFAVSTNSVFGTVEFISSQARQAGGLSGDPSWVDHAIGRNSRAVFLYTTDIDVDQHILWQNEFWNRSVRRVFGVTSQDPSIPDVTAPLDPATGEIKPVLPASSPDRQPKYAVAATPIDVAGEVVARSEFLTLHRVDSPLRLASTTGGLYPDGWAGAAAAYNRYALSGRGPATVEVLVSREGVAGPPPAAVQIVAGKLRARGTALTVDPVWSTRRWIVRNGATRRFVLRVPAPPFRVEVRISPTFSPTQYGSADTRQLGARVSFRVVGQG